MSSVTLSAPGRPTVDREPRATARPAFWLRPGWPLAFALVPFGLWWLLGISSFIGPIAAVFMAVELVRRHAIRVPKGFGWWALLVLWVAVGALVLQVNAPGAVPSHATSRYFTWAFRLSWYVAATVTLLYVGNLRRELPFWRVSRMLGWMFLTIAAGGWLGILFPHLSFPSLLEALLPHGIAHEPFVNFLIHPTIAQANMNAVSGPRPAAPFGYANIWGLNFAVFLPFFVHAWFGRKAGWRRAVAPVLLLVALVPAVASLNRGLWAVLAGTAVLIAAQAALRGRVALLAALLAAMIGLGALLVLTPAGDLVAFRLANGMSEGTRSNLGMATIQSVATGSPVVGFGTTRDVQGSFLSIAGGDSALCPDCAPPALGTQGHLWLVAFSQGLVGLFFYLTFYVTWFLRGLRLKSGVATVGVVVLFAHLVTLPIYDYIGIAMVPVMVAVAYLWRERDRERAGTSTDEAAKDAAPVAQRVRSGAGTLATHLRLLQRNALVIVLCVVAGTATAWVTLARNGSHGVASVSIYLPPEPGYLTNDGPPSTMDTEAFLARDQRILDTVGRTVGHPVTARDVYISANPNTRILNVRFEGRSVEEAAAGAAAAATDIMRQRRERMTALQQSVLKPLTARAASLDASIATMEDQLAAMAGKRTLDLNLEVQSLRNTRARLIAETGVIHSRIGRASSEEFEGGSIVRPPVADQSDSGMRSVLLSGAMVGFLVGLVLSLVRRARTHRLGDGRWVYADTGLPLLAAQSSADPVPAPDAVSTLRRGRPPVFLSVDNSGESLAVIESFDRSLGASSATPPGTGGANPVVLVARNTTRLRTLQATIARLSLAGHKLAGVVVAR